MCDYDSNSSTFWAINGTSTGFGCNGNCADSGMNFCASPDQPKTFCTGGSSTIAGEQVACTECSLGNGKSLCYGQWFAPNATGDFNDLVIRCGSGVSCPEGYMHVYGYNGGDGWNQVGGTVFLQRPNGTGGLVVSGPDWVSNANSNCQICAKPLAAQQPIKLSSVPTSQSALWVIGEVGETGVNWLFDPSYPIGPSNSTTVAYTQNGFNWGTMNLTGDMKGFGSAPVSVLNMNAPFNDIQRMPLNKYSLDPDTRTFKGCAKNWYPVYVKVGDNLDGIRGTNLKLVDANGTIQEVQVSLNDLAVLPTDVGPPDSPTYGLGFCLHKTEIDDSNGSNDKIKNDKKSYVNNILLWSCVLFFVVVIVIGIYLMITKRK